MVAALEATDQGVSLQPHPVFHNTVDVVSNVNSTIHDEVYSVHVVKLVVDYCPFRVFYRLKVPQKVYHEVTVCWTVPVQVSILVLGLKVLKLKESLELKNKASEQKVFINSYLYLLRELLKNGNISFRLNGNIPVIVPLVVEVLLHVHLEIMFDRVPLVEIVKQPKEL